VGIWEKAKADRSQLDYFASKGRFLGFEPSA
jgi:hypothetical protein